MKKLFFVSGILVLSCYAIGQARDGTANFKRSGKDDHAVMIYLPYAPAVVQSALFDYLSKTTKREQKAATGFLLSCNTSLVKNNIKEHDMVFEIGSIDYFHPNETVIYLKLNSNAQSRYNESSTENHFDMNDANGYLDNLSIAIKPYATDMQLRLQKKDLKNAQDKNLLLSSRGTELEQDRMQILNEISSHKTGKKTDKLLKRKIRNQQQIDANVAAKVRNDKAIEDQVSALALLENTIKFNGTN